MIDQAPPSSDSQSGPKILNSEYCRVMSKELRESLLDQELKVDIGRKSSNNGPTSANPVSVNEPVKLKSSFPAGVQIS
jgi:hypothetical protein